MDAREPCQDREGAAISGSVRVPQIHLLMDCRLSKDVFYCFKQKSRDEFIKILIFYVTGKPPVPLQTKNKRKRGTSCENSSFFVFRISTRPASLLARLFHLGNPLFAFFRKLLRPWKQVLQKIQIRIVHVFRNLGQ